MSKPDVDSILNISDVAWCGEVWCGVVWCSVLRLLAWWGGEGQGEVGQTVLENGMLVQIKLNTTRELMDYDT